MVSLLKEARRLFLNINLNLRKIDIYRKRRFSACSRYIEEAFELSKNKDIGLVPYRIKGYVLGNRFSNAIVDMVQYLEDTDGCVRDPSSISEREMENETVFTSSLKFSSLYKKGFDSIQRKNTNNRNDPQFISDEIMQFAIQSFISGFLINKEYHEQCLRSVLETSDERKIIVLLANHLLSRLIATSPGNTYFITDDHWKQYELCPCDYQCGDKIWYGNSGIGTELLWYGKPDIMLFPLGGNCSIVIPKDKSLENLSEKEEQHTDVKKELKLLREHSNVSQFVAQAITFSFYQKRFQLLKPDYYQPIVTLIPTIAINDKCFDVYMYDTENDILLRNDGDPIPLWNNLHEPSDATLDMGSVLQLWMLINHLAIQPILSQSELEKFSGTCGFSTSLTDDHLNKIEMEVKMRSKFIDHN
ncbi:uncharacterized protein LOC127722111 isoform X1 [Mytilus californianus]|uniref:uncharacterized protein LOC127722111 isoform X1 n=1 Tax=Mytilus californianus TaxID=6549 RepID=UPI00224821FF|nr:uncharacterized protein LOC127722111 isoform X1 [Mytilus californianus]